MSLAPSHGPFLVHADGAVVTVTVDHPPTNVMDGELVMGLRSLLDDLDLHAETKVVLFTSADPDFFVMHGDVEALVQVPAHEFTPPTEPNIAAATLQRLAAAPFLSIAVLDGAARGGGAEFATACDLRFASPRTVLGQPEVPMGILPGAGGTARLPRLIGRGPALRVLLTGRDVDADEALSIGWIDAMVPSAELLTHAQEFAGQVADMPAPSIAAVKRVVDVSLAPLDDALLAESTELGRAMAAGAHVEPMRRFLDAGGQTRKGETDRMAEINRAMLD